MRNPSKKQSSLNLISLRNDLVGLLCANVAIAAVQERMSTSMGYTFVDSVSERWLQG